MRNQEIIGLMEAYSSIYANLSESHFKVGDEVVCKKSGMEGEVVKVDPEEKGKYYTVKREDGKMVKYAPDELKLESEEKEEDEKDNGEEMKEEVEIDEDAGIVSGLVGLALGAKGAYNAAKKSKRMRDYPKNFVKGIADPRTYVPQKKKEQKEEFDIFDVILEHLVAEGYADTNQAALVIMANMSEEWREEIIEAAKDQSNKQIEKGIKTTYKAGNVIDNQHQGRSKGLNKLPAGERKAKTERMRERLKGRRDDLFKERGNREDAARAELKKRLGL